MSLISLTVNSDWSKRSKIFRRISSEMAPKSSMFGMIGSRFWRKFEFITLPAKCFFMFVFVNINFKKSCVCFFE